MGLPSPANLHVGFGGSEGLISYRGGDPSSYPCRAWFVPVTPAAEQPPDEQPPDEPATAAPEQG